MSALIAHAKAYRALALAYEEIAAGREDWKPEARFRSVAYSKAADILEQQARDECSTKFEPTKKNPGDIEI